MSDAWQVLGLSSDADEKAVRKRYLELVRQHSPERSPQRFSEIQAAYDELRDPARRLRRQLFDIGDVDSLEDIIAEVRGRLRNARIPVDVLLSLAEGSFDVTQLQAGR